MPDCRRPFSPGPQGGAARKRKAMEDSEDEAEPAAGPRKAPALEDSDGEHPTGRRAAKKRAADSDSDDDDDEYDSEDSELRGLPELERERLIAERAEARLEKERTARLLALAAKGDKDRGAKGAKKGRGRRRGSDDDDDDDDFDDEDDEERTAKPRRAAARRTAGNKETEAMRALQRQRQRNLQRKADRLRDLQDDDDDAGGEDEAGRDDDSESADVVSERDDDDAGHEDADYKEAAQICLPRFKLLEWYDQPHFADVVRGCLVRVLVSDGLRGDAAAAGAVYRVVEVLEVVSLTNKVATPFGAVKSPYEWRLSENNKMTSDRFLYVKFGKHKAHLPLYKASNSPMTEAEYNLFCDTIAKEEGKEGLLTLRRVSEARERIAQANAFVWRAEDIAEMIAKRKAEKAKSQDKAQWTFGELVAEKARVESEMVVAVDRDDKPKAEKLRGQLAELDQLMRKKGGAMMLQPVVVKRAQDARRPRARAREGAAQDENGAREARRAPELPLVKSVEDALAAVDMGAVAAPPRRAGPRLAAGWAQRMWSAQFDKPGIKKHHIRDFMR
ncbi:unnamed protein product [Pedinophyceae sp. YPF-701]|nr:unnamed protein product [Pedinophyceae sp. YPF-701]